MASPSKIARLITKGKKALRYQSEISAVKRRAKKKNLKDARKIANKIINDQIASEPTVGKAVEGLVKRKVKEVVKNVVKNPKKEARKLKEAYKQTGGIKHVIARTTKPGYRRTKRGALQGHARDPESFGYSQGGVNLRDTPNWAGHGDKPLATVLQRRGAGHITTPDPGVDDMGRPFLAISESVSDQKLMDNLVAAGRDPLEILDMRMAQRYPKDIAPKTVDLVHNAGKQYIQQLNAEIRGSKALLKSAIKSGDEKQISKARRNLYKAERAAEEINREKDLAFPSRRSVTRHERAHTIHQENAVYQMVARLQPKEKKQILLFWRNKQTEALIAGDRAKVDKYERAIEAVEDLGSGGIADVLRAQGLAGIPARVKATQSLLRQAGHVPGKSSAQDIQNLSYSLSRPNTPILTSTQHYADDLGGLSSLLTESGARASEITGMRGPLQGLRRARIGFTRQVLDPALSASYASQSPQHAWALKKARPAAYAAKYAPHAGVGTVGAGGGYLGYKIMEDD